MQAEDRLEAQAPQYRTNKAFEDSSGHPQWPKVADTVIEAERDTES
jgi:hypothetical protein